MGEIHMMDKMEFCNSFEKGHYVFIGHDYGGAIWFQAVRVKESDKILCEDVEEIGKEISVYIHFFDDVLEPIFKEVFDPEMYVNKNRYTYAFSDEGRYLNCFEENILEYNFFSYDQVNEIISRIEDMIEDGLQGKEKGTEEGEVSQLKALVSYLRMIMEESPDTNLIGMLS